MKEENEVIEGEAVEVETPQIKTVLFYDTETTGLPNWKKPSGDESQPHLVQLGAILCNEETQEIISSIDLIVKADEWEIPEEVAKIHGITTEISHAHGIEEGFATVLMHMLNSENTTRVAYNKTFDQRIIRIAMKRYCAEEVIENWAKKEDHECAMRMAQKVIGGKNPKLAVAYEHFTGKKLENAHTAIADAKACMEVYFAIKNAEKH